MNKKLITFVLGAVCASACFAQDMVTLVVTNVSTNAAAATTDIATMTGKCKGWVDCLYVSIATNAGHVSPTCTVSLVTQGTGDSRPAQTIYSKTVTANTGPQYIRVKPVTTTAVACGTNINRIALFSDRLIFSAYAKVAKASTNTIKATCTVILSPVP